MVATSSTRSFWPFVRILGASWNGKYLGLDGYSPRRRRAGHRAEIIRLASVEKRGKIGRATNSAADTRYNLSEVQDLVNSSHGA